MLKHLGWIRYCKNIWRCFYSDVDISTSQSGFCHEIWNIWRCLLNTGQIMRKCNSLWYNYHWRLVVKNNNVNARVHNLGFIHIGYLLNMLQMGIKRAGENKSGCWMALRCCMAVLLNYQLLLIMIFCRRKTSATKIWQWMKLFII